VNYTEEYAEILYKYCCQHCGKMTLKLTLYGDLRVCKNCQELLENQFAKWYLFGKCKCGIYHLTDYPFISCGSCGQSSAGNKESHEKGIVMDIPAFGFCYPIIEELAEKYFPLRWGFIQDFEELTDFKLPDELLEEFGYNKLHTCDSCKADGLPFLIGTKLSTDSWGDSPHLTCYKCYKTYDVKFKKEVQE